MGYLNQVRKRYAVGIAVMSLAAILGPGCGGGGTNTSASTGTGTTVGAGGSTSSSTTTGAGGAGGTGTTTTSTTTSTTTGSGTGGAGGGGTGGGAPGAGHAGTELVSAGEKASSPKYKMRFTLGQPSQNQGTTTSTKYRIQGGLVGANGSLP